MTESEQIDKLLQDRASQGHLYVPEESPASVEKALDKAMAFRLFTRLNYSYHLTERGYEVLQAGGIDRWLLARQRRDSEAHRATVDSATLARRAVIAAWASGGIALASLLFALYQWNASRQLEQQVNALQARVKTVYTLVKDQSKNQPPKVVPVKTKRTP